MPSKLEIANEQWGEDLPVWVATLAQSCDGSSQNAVARAVGYSSATISYVIANRYTGNLPAVEARVRGALMQEKITCPALGEIGMHTCADWRAKAKTFVPCDPRRTRMRRACRQCPRNTTDTQNGED